MKNTMPIQSICIFNHRLNVMQFISGVMYDNNSLEIDVQRLNYIIIDVCIRYYFMLLFSIQQLYNVTSSGRLAVTLMVT